MNRIIQLTICVLLYGFFTSSIESETKIIDYKEPKEYIKFQSINAPNHVNDFIKRWHLIAQYEHEKYGIPASIKLAQAAKESGWAVKPKGNAFFGIKWQGSGDYITRKEGKFSAYKTAWHSFRAHSLFIQRAHYRSCFTCRDYKCWAKELKKNGYAEDPNYAEGLIEIIEKYKLDRYDN